MENEQLDRFNYLVTKANWIFAKTYAETSPHEYILRKMYSRLDFEFMVRFIRLYGISAKYGKMKPLRYLIAKPYYYWTMGAPVDETVVINRAELDRYQLINGVWSLK